MRVWVRYNSIFDDGCVQIANALQVNMGLTKLNLEGNNIKDAGAEAIAAALEVNSRLFFLGLGSNQIEDTGGKALARALDNSTGLSILDLEGNSINDEGGVAIAGLCSHAHCRPIGSQITDICLVDVDDVCEQLLQLEIPILT